MARVLVERGFSLTELVVAVAILAILVTTAAPMYRSYVEHTRRAAMVEEMVALAPVQESLRRTAGAYATGEFDRSRGIDSLLKSLGWRPRTGDQWAVVAFEDFWVARAGEGGVAVCRRFPENTPCTDAFEAN